jgi:acyl carrier protein
MTRVTAHQVREFLVTRFADPLSAKGLGPGQIPDDFDLLTEGVVDSFGVLEMISAMEEHFGVSIDYERLDPEDLTVIGPLSRFVESQSGADSGRTAP